MDITQALVNMIKAELVGPREFSTGSSGFHASAKIMIDGVKYQTQAQAILIGSKADPAMQVFATVDEIAVVLAGLVVDQLQARRFSTGRTGYRADGKTQAHGQRFQASVQAVRLS